MHTSLRRTYLLGALFVLALTALFAAANAHWLAANTVTYGWDRLDHLIASFVYRDILGELTPRSALAALAYSDYYPPLVHYGAVLLYRLFGVSEDVAPMVNIFYLAILLGATFWIAARWSCRGTRSGEAAFAGAARPTLPDLVPPHALATGALAAALVGLFPILFAMSRYFYLDFALAALVALCMALLLASERFTRRWPALGFGLILGLAFLVKWTAAAFVVGPLLYLVVRSGVLPYVWRSGRSLLPHWGRLALCLAAGAAVIGAWFALAGDVVATLRLGWWLALPLALLLGGVFYSLFAAGRTGAPQQMRLRHLLGAGVIAAFLIALWYLTNVEFLDYFLFTAYGREEEPFYAFAKYAGEVFNEQLGPWFALVFAVVALARVWQAWRRTRRDGWSLRLGDTAWVLLLWVVVPYCVFSFRVTLAHSRFLMPFLPPFAIWMAVGLMQWRPRVLRIAAISVILLVGVAQYALITFDELAAWRAPLRLQIAGEPRSLLAHGFFIQYPTSDVTDPGYAVAPEVLRYVNRQRAPGGSIAGKEVANLGLLVNSYQVHEKHFLYSIYKDFPQVRLRELARNWSDQPAYNQLFDMDFVLVSDTHTFRTNENSQAAVQRILYDPADAFNQAFAPVRQWTLPSGEQLTLYGRRFTGLEPGVAPGDYQQLLALFGDRLGPGDAVVLVSPDQVYMLGLALPADAGATIAPLPMAGEGESATLQRLQELAAARNRIFLVSHNADQADPAGSIESWLRANLVPANELWAGAVRVTPFVARPAGDLTDLQPAAWPQGPRLAAATAPATAAAGGALVVQTTWAPGDNAPDAAAGSQATESAATAPGAESPADAAAGQAAADTRAGETTSQPTAPAAPSSLRASLQLLAPDGTLVAQEDRDLPMPGSAAVQAANTADQVNGDATGTSQDFVLLIPRSSAPGDYRLVLVLYDPATGQRYPTAAGTDFAELGTVRITAAPAPSPVTLPPLRHPDDAADEGS